MSQIDIIEAKQALARCLQNWLANPTPDETYLRASGFVDDLVRRGWIMDPLKERRPPPPRKNEACLTCSKHLNQCICGERRTRPTPSVDPTHHAAAARAAMREGGL